MELQTKGGTAVGVSDAVFDAPYNEALVHQVVTAYMAGARSGNSRSPIWRAGGVTFASEKRDYSVKVNRKMYRGALRTIVSELARSGRLIVVDSIDVAEPKTKIVRNLLADWSVTDVLIIDADLDANVHLAARNLPHVTTTDVDGINPWLILRHESVVISAAALKKLEERLA